MFTAHLANFFRDQAVLVTGASGFIGWHVAQRLVDAGAKVRALIRPATLRQCNELEQFEWIEGDLTDRKSLERALKGCRYLFHVAGDYRFWARDPRTIHAANVQGTINVLDAARSAGIEKIVVTSTTGILKRGTIDQLANESQLASAEHLSGPYKSSKFAAFLETNRRAKAGWPIVTVLPTAPIGPHDIKPTPTGMIIVQFLNGRIPMLARTGLNFVDVRQCALGHLLAMVNGEPAERYLLGGVNLWLREFLQRLEPYSKHRAPEMHAPHWLSFATACASEIFARISPRWVPFVTRESVRMSRDPHFSSNAKAEQELGYDTIPIEDAIRDAIQDFFARGLVPAPIESASAPIHEPQPNEVYGHH